VSLVGCDCPLPHPGLKNDEGKGDGRHDIENERDIRELEANIIIILNMRPRRVRYNVNEYVLVVNPKIAVSSSGNQRRRIKFPPGIMVREFFD
jgi:hypothetical protein